MVLRVVQLQIAQGLLDRRVVRQVTRVQQREGAQGRAPERVHLVVGLPAAAGLLALDEAGCRAVQRLVDAHVQALLLLAGRGRREQQEAHTETPHAQRQ